MRTTFTVLLLAGLTTAILVAGNRTAARSVPGPNATSAQGDAADPLIVHEWGTFTSVSGSDGLRLEFRPLVDEDLPGFVLNRAEQSGIPDPSPSKAYRVFQRMETPVTYFYTQRERQVQVKVGFPQGLLTEFYPPVAGMKPAFQWNKRAGLGQSELDWGTVTLIPVSHLETQVTTSASQTAVRRKLLDALLPGNLSEDHYVYARETDSALVHVHRPAGRTRSVAPRGDFFEKFLFYRGLGNFPLPLAVNALGQDSFEIVNSGAGPIQSLFLVTVQAGQVRFQTAAQVPAGGRIALQQSSQVSSSEALSSAVVAALAAEKLYPREAQAMVKTWRDSWFQEEGTRLFYMLPRPLTDELLPLTISPTPAELVRVMVGRLEIMTPESEQHVRDVVLASSRHRKAEMIRRGALMEAAHKQGEPSPQFKDPVARLPEALVSLGRLAEPALVRAKYYSTDAVIQHEAGLLLTTLHQQWAEQSAR